MTYEVPVPDEVKELLNSIGNIIGPQLPKGWGFTLLIFTFGEGGTMTYISNAERESMIEAMNEFMKHHDPKRRS